ncbi:MAG TPA: tyrosine--tRNA ligase [Verrucomicrobiales bacterium]|nr:tyrosine--tRNA ligase [Verrucomicrobiales bacterium]
MTSTAPASAQDQLATLSRGAERIVSSEELAAKLRRGSPLRVKLGLDPTAPDLHLGHTVAFQKLREFQELGHQVVLIIGDFTAMIGDPSGRSATRPPLTREEVLANAETYTDQAFRILDRDSTEVRHNGDWFRKMDFTEVMRLNSRVTLQQMLQREDFRSRIDQGHEVRLHEIQYPLMQGWDSVVIRADVELGGSDQLFNVLVGRDLQKSAGIEPQVAFLLPLLEGLDGVKKMSKSLGNYVALNESPDEMFGKIMSISDPLMNRYAALLFGETPSPDLHPMEAKKQLACRIVERYHGPDASKRARATFEARFSHKADSHSWPDFTPEPGADLVSLVASAFSTIYNLPRSNSEIRRLIQQGSIQLNGAKLTDPVAVPILAPGDLLKLDKKRTVRAAVP